MSTANHRSKRRVAVTAVYLLLAFLSAFELFLIQPLIAKRILPWFGGVASVWTACMLFFQSLLFIGYCYAYIISLLRTRTQIVAHVLFLGLSLALLLWQCLTWGTPIIPPQEWALMITDSCPPTAAVIALLGISVGLPYLLLSSTSPLLQAWFYGRENTKSPLFFFYAVSNAGSLIALVCYPVLFEPLLRLPNQALLWAIGYVGFAIVCALCSIHAMRTVGKAALVVKGRDTSLKQQIAQAPWRDGLVWLGLSAVASLMLVAMTNQICANVAPIPLLWILPLALYLIAFIVCFSSHGKGTATLAAILMLPATALVLFIMQHALQLGILPQLAVYCLALTCACFLCLGMLHSRRPPPLHLTFFYVMLALGGALGGLFVGVIAPLIFSDYWELRIGLGLACSIATWLLLEKPWILAWRVPLIVATLAVMVGLTRMPSIPSTQIVARARSFFGALKVLEQQIDEHTSTFSLMHGRICHGLQFNGGPLHRQPSMYFGKNSGICVAVNTHPKRTSPYAHPGGLRVGILGLGIGTIAAYGEEGDSFRFYEINHDVVKLATNRDHFRYLTSCPSHVEIIMGDARLSLEQELLDGGSHDFDILVLDVFNGDAIPVHLLTAEAFDTYLSHLDKESGILALHLTNMYMDLVPVASSIARHYGLSGRIISTPGDLRLTSDSLWVLLTRNKTGLPSEQEDDLSFPFPEHMSHRVWTDDFSDVLSVIEGNLFTKGVPTHQTHH